MSYPVFATGDVLNASDMNAVGMWKTGSYAFTGQATLQLNNCFTADFDRYLINYNLRVGAGAVGLQMRLSVGGTPNATAGSYILGGRYVGFPTVGVADYNAATTQWDFSYMGTFGCTAQFFLSEPFAARPTSFSGTSMSTNAAAFSGGYHNQSTSYDGIYLFNSGAAALYGSIGVYGIRN